MNVMEVLLLILLFAIAAELGFIIFKARKNLDQAQNQLLKTQDQLMEAQQEWIQAFSILLTSLPSGPIEGTGSQWTAATEALQLQDKTLGSLNTVLQELSISLQRMPATNKPDSDPANTRIDQTVEQLNDAVRKLFNTCATFTQGLVKDRQLLSHELLDHFKYQREEWSSLINSLQLSLNQTQRPALTSSSSTVPARETLQPEYASNSTFQPELDSRRAQSSDDSIRPEPRRLTNKGDEKFKKLREWVTSNLQNIMSRSLNQWNAPEELLLDAPPNLDRTAKLLDPDSKLILIGTEGHSQYLAVALPGGYIGSSFYDWFIIPKGTNVRVEKTLTPALVEVGASGYYLLEHGSVAQD
jgi:hypothetical protein